MSLTRKNTCRRTADFFRNMEGRFKGRYFDSITESFGKKLGKGGKKTTTGDSSPNGSITIPKDSFKNAGTAVPARFVMADAVSAKKKQPLRPVFAKWLVSKENPYFAPAFVNRTWSYFFGRGLVLPIDDMRAGNPPSHPEILDLLTEEFIDSNFNVKHLIRCLVNTRAYQRTSAAKNGAERKALDKFGRRPMKLMSADQLYDSLKLALADPKLDLRTYDSKESKQFGESSPVGDQYTEFQRLFETDENDSTNFTHGIPQFLALLNHPRVSSGGPKVARMLKDKIEPAAAVEELYLSTLSRRPTDEETKEAVEYISENGPSARQTFSPRSVAPWTSTTPKNSTPKVTVPCRLSRKALNRSTNCSDLNRLSAPSLKCLSSGRILVCAVGVTNLG